MQWSELFDGNRQPTDGEITEFIGTPLWDELNTYLKEEYHVQPKLSYSSCSMQKGWNIKYRKSGAALCTLYPMAGFFITLVVINERAMPEMELSLPLFSDSFRQLYGATKTGMGQKWLMIEVRDNETLDDVKRCVAIRRNVK